MDKNKFGEHDSLIDLGNHIDATYGKHYAKGNIQALEIIIDDGDTLGFCRGGVIKYLRRYGKKNGHNLDDLMKAAHLILVLHAQEKKRLNDEVKNGNV